MFQIYYHEGYITGVGETRGMDGGVSAEEYGRVLAAIRALPAGGDGYEYRLRADLTVERVTVEADDEIGDAEALAIITGGA